ncbi:MAG: esterase-like of phytase family protein [Sphingomonadales bacterium]|nr:esterase-like of phytase family protein [Sphingomonadales bacterium]
MRWPVLLCVFFLGQCVRSSTTHDLTPVANATITIDAQPVPLYADNLEHSRIGALEYLGGWRLTSDNPAFGGLSSLDVAGNSVTALSDAGGLVRFRIGKFGHISNATIAPVPAGCGGGREKTGRDTESIAHDRWSGHWWIGFEWRNVICRTNGDLGIGERVTQPPQMANWSRSSGPETLLRLTGGRFLAIAEANPQGGKIRPIVMFGGDPTDPKIPRVMLGYLPPTGFSPTDATELPDGRILILNRSFALTSLFTACVTMIDPKSIRGGAVLHGPVIARFESPAISENFEGIASGTENGRTVVWIISDDNFASWQRTLLLKFALTEARAN